VRQQAPAGRVWSHCGPGVGAGTWGPRALASAPALHAPSRRPIPRRHPLPPALASWQREGQRGPGVGAGTLGPWALASPPALHGPTRPPAVPHDAHPLAPVLARPPSSPSSQRPPPPVQPLHSTPRGPPGQARARGPPGAVVHGRCEGGRPGQHGRAQRFPLPAPPPAPLARLEPRRDAWGPGDPSPPCRCQIDTRPPSQARPMHGWATRGSTGRRGGAPSQCPPASPAWPAVGRAPPVHGLHHHPVDLTFKPCAPQAALRPPIQYKIDRDGWLDGREGGVENTVVPYCWAKLVTGLVTRSSPTLSPCTKRKKITSPTACQMISCDFLASF
jgi:hypothetical protein